MKNQELDLLFDDWKSKIYSSEKCFIRDGIINEEQWGKANKKILFIAKEANNKEDEDWDFRDWWKDSINYIFSYRIAEWSCGLLGEQFPSFDEINNYNDKFNAIQKIAFMNINKLGGGSSSNNSLLKIHIENSREFILKQIEIINPDIIVSCIGDWLNDYLFSEENWQKTGYSVWVKRFGKAKIISFLHPSARSYASAPYCLLKSVVESETFKNI